VARHADDFAFFLGIGHPVCARVERVTFEAALDEAYRAGPLG
jgi:hypothetical protein